jgi:hypothetical protein
VSLLERLKREAEQQKAAQEAEARVREERDRVYLGEIDPRMKALVEYLEGLLHTLQQLKPQVYVKLPIQGYGDLAALPLFDFKFNADRRYRSWLLELDWTLRVDPERTPVVSANTATRVRALSDAFRALHLGGVKELRRNNSQEIVEASFHARGHIKANMKATISQDDPVLRLSFTNVSWLGTSRRQMPWQQIDELLFDRLGRYLAREDDSLFTEELPEELKQRLRTEGSTIPASALTAPNPAPPAQNTPPAPPSAPQAASIPVTAPTPVAAPPRPAPSGASADNAATVSAPASPAQSAVWSGDLAAPPPLSADGAKLLNSDEEEAMMRALAALDPSLVEGDAKPVPAATPPAAVAAPVTPVAATPAPARPAAAPAPAVVNPPRASTSVQAPTPAPMVPPAAATRAVPAPAVQQAAAPSNTIAPTPSPPPVAAPPQTAVPAAPAREVALAATTAAPVPVPAAPAAKQPAPAPASAAELLAQATSSGGGTGAPLQGNARMASFLSRMSKTLTQLRDEEEKKKG